jgi:hypothetical protein
MTRPGFESPLVHTFQGLHDIRKAGNCRFGHKTSVPADQVIAAVHFSLGAPRWPRGAPRETWSAEFVLGYSLKTSAGPLTRSTIRSTVTSARSAILMKGIPGVHPVALPVKRHRAFNLTVSGSFSGKGQIQRFVLRDSANGKSSLNFSGVRAGLYNLGGVKRDHRVLINVEEILTLQLSVLHAASGVHAGTPFEGALDRREGPNQFFRALQKMQIWRSDQPVWDPIKLLIYL